MSRWEPACMSAEEYAYWRAGAEIARRRAGVIIPRPCADCPASFRNEALVAGNCNGHRPNIRKRTKHDEKRLIQWREAEARKRAGVRVRRSAEEVDALAFHVRELHALGASWAAIGRRLNIDHTYARDLWYRKDRAA